MKILGIFIMFVTYVIITVHLIVFIVGVVVGNIEDIRQSLLVIAITAPLSVYVTWAGMKTHEN